jgi:hypothetical protein
MRAVVALDAVFAVLATGISRTYSTNDPLVASAVMMRKMFVPIVPPEPSLVVRAAVASTDGVAVACLVN